ncbi:hypothetical protein SprV_0401428800 [Sparganum proliferum]
MFLEVDKTYSGLIGLLVKGIGKLTNDCPESLTSILFHLSSESTIVRDFLHIIVMSIWNSRQIAHSNCSNLNGVFTGRGDAAINGSIVNSSTSDKNETGGTGSVVTPPTPSSNGSSGDAGTNSSAPNATQSTPSSGGSDEGTSTSNASSLSMIHCFLLPFLLSLVAKFCGIFQYK